LKFVSVSFLDEPLPQESQWLIKYFQVGIRRAFLNYFMCFRSSVRFSEHTGLSCSKRYLKEMKSELLRLEKAHSESKDRLDFEAVADIEMGLFKL
jgi:hypothetical protein